MFRIPCRHFVWLARLSIFIHADILVLVSEFVMVVIFLSGAPTAADHCGHISDELSSGKLHM